MFALFALVACSGAAPETESTSVEVPSITDLPTSSPKPSATIFPTENATLTPTPQPSLTATSVSTATQEPTKEPTPTPTPKGPETYGLVFSTATEAEIESALDLLARENNLPLQYYTDFQGYELWGVLANSEIVQRDFEGGYKVVYQAEFHYIVNGEKRQFDVNLLTTRDDGDLIRTSQTAIPRQLDNAALIRFSWKGLLTKPTMPIRLMINAPIQNELVNPHADPGDMQPNAFLTPIFEQLGFDNEALKEFVNSGDPEYLPMVDGRRFLPVPWMYPEK